jgi:hypothetical protein
MWEPRRLKTPWASKACYMDSFYLYCVYTFNSHYTMKSEYLYLTINQDSSAVRIQLTLKLLALCYFTALFNGAFNSSDYKSLNDHTNSKVWNGLVWTEAWHNVLARHFPERTEGGHEKPQGMVGFRAEIWTWDSPDGAGMVTTRT